MGIRSQYRIRIESENRYISGIDIARKLSARKSDAYPTNQVPTSGLKIDQAPTLRLPLMLLLCSEWVVV